MKIQKIKNFLKKFFASTMLAIFTMGIFSPLASAQQRWHVSSLDKTFFEIPPDDRNLEDFVFTNQIFHYKDWYNNEDRWISKEARITNSMVWYKYFMDTKPSASGLSKITSQDISTFFIIVNNHYYNTDGTFAFPIYYNQGVKYIYLYWKMETEEGRYGNYCLFMDLENQGQEIFKIENTCGSKFLNRDPFLLFFQVERTSHQDAGSDSFKTSFYNRGNRTPPLHKISVTTTNKVTHQDKPYINFYKPENFYLNEESGLTIGSNSLLNGDYSTIIMDDGHRQNLFNSFKSYNFLRKGNQRAFRSYSFLFEEDYKSRILELQAKNDTNCLREACHILLPAKPISFFESFVLSVAAQYYNSPAVTNDNTYIEVPDPIKGEGFEPMKYEDCSNYDIGCHARNIGRSVYNFINESVLGKISDDAGNNPNNDANLLFKYANYKKCSFFDVFCHIQNLGLAIYNGIGMVLNGIVGLVKNIFSGAFNSFLETEFYKTWIQPIYDYFSSFVKVIFNLFTGKYDWNTLWWGNQEYFCSKNPELFFIETTTNQGDKPIETLGSIMYLINPIPPKEGSQICTSLGLKTINYGKSTILDLFLFNIFVFAGIWFMFLFLRKYN